jgi:hypothetical protein
VKAITAKKKSLKAIKSESERTRSERQIRQLEVMIDDLVYTIYGISVEEKSAIQNEIEVLMEASKNAKPTEEQLELDD